MICVKTVKMMKEGVERAGLKAHYMVQPLAYHTPDCNCQGFIDLPEFPFGTHTITSPSQSLSCTLVVFFFYFSSFLSSLLSPLNSLFLTTFLSPRSGAQDSDQVGHAQVRQGGLQRWHPFHWRLLRLRALPHQGCS